eukprot:6168770-Alexandrium_andersonii.AAC.1
MGHAWRLPMAAGSPKMPLPPPLAEFPPLAGSLPPGPTRPPRAGGGAEDRWTGRLGTARLG